MSRNPSIQTIALNFIEKKTNKTFTELINRLRPGLLSFAYKYVKNRDLSQEVVSQTFHIVWEKIEQYNPEYNFSTWVYAIAKNEALGLLRNRNKHLSHDRLVENHSKVLQAYSPTFSMNIECIAPSGEELTQKLYDASILAINELNEPYRTVMYEREINQKQLQDIAVDLNWNLSTVKTRLRKARQDVAGVLSKRYPELVDSYFEHENYL